MLLPFLFPLTPLPPPLRAVERAAQHGVLRTKTVSAVLHPKDGEGRGEEGGGGMCVGGTLRTKTITAVPLRPKDGDNRGCFDGGQGGVGVLAS